MWLAQFRQTSELRSREKNWSPFSWRGGVYLEYSLQPRLVLALNRRTGVCSPVLPLTSSAGVQAWLDKLGPASGGPPSVLPNVEGAVLAVPQLTTLSAPGGQRSLWIALHGQKGATEPLASVSEALRSKAVDCILLFR